MQSLSVVIVCKNEAGIIGTTLQSLQGLTDDMLVYDNGSTDDTVAISQQLATNVIQGEWEGFGKTKQKAVALARYDWILSLDADESVDEGLKNALLGLPLNDESVVYEIKFKNYFGQQWLKFGEWGNDSHIRLFNRKKVNWNDAPVHEELVLSGGVQVKKLKGHVLHYTATDVEKYKVKLMKYAALNAKKYFEQGKKTGPLKKYFSAFFSFIQNYIFRAGFLDGKAGYRCAVLTAGYTFAKYKNLEQLLRNATTLQKH
ncbi:MAG TPA: glycosyltransferase family 2 protein [Chitinophagaceae bacterium]|nr:glycosyltransferase family 2 protein [Chitinophagaceae bacterium]